MALTEKAKNLTLNGSWLSGEVLKADGTWTMRPVTIDLNDKLGNTDGHFDLGSSGFANRGSAENIRLVGTTLHASLTKRDRRTLNEDTLDLAFALSVVNGTFFFSKAKYEHMMSIENGDVELKEFIREFKANSRNLRIVRTMLSGETMKRGRWTGQDTIDLQYKLGNNNGRFEVNGTNFAATARGIRVEGITLRAELTKGYQRPEAFVELAAVLKVVDGCFFFRSEYENRSVVSPLAESLADNSRNLRLTDVHSISGEIRKDNGWVNESIDLAPKLGNLDGKFDLTRETNFHTNAAEVRLEGATLCAYLKTRAGYHKDDSINLALILKVVNWKFVFVPYERRLLPSDFEGPGLVSNSRNLYIRGGRVSGETKKPGGSWTTDSIDLGTYIGNDRGRFNLDQKRFTWSASEFRLKGTTLLASLNNGSSWPSEASLDLSLILSVNADGNFVFMTAHQRKRIVSSVFCMFVEIEAEKVELNGLCLNKYGKLTPSSIDLNNYYKFDGGSFTSDEYGEGSRNFAKTATAVRVNVTAVKVSLEAMLPNRSVAEVNLNINIENRDGRFHFNKNDSLFARDGAGTKFLEGLPIIGYMVALVHQFNGDDEWAKRAAAVATNSTIVFVAVTIGSLAGGPLGAALGAGIASPIGIALETVIKKRIADDVAIQFEDATVGRYVYETLRNMLAAGASAKFGKWASKQNFGGAWGEWESTRVFKEITTFGARKGSSATVGGSVKKIIDAIANDKLPQEWLNVEEVVRKL